MSYRSITIKIEDYIKLEKIKEFYKKQKIPTTTNAIGVLFIQRSIAEWEEQNFKKE